MRLVGQLVYTSVLGTGYATHLLPASLLVGGGIAATYPAATIVASSAAPTHAQATAAGVAHDQPAGWRRGRYLRAHNRTDGGFPGRCRWCSSRLKASTVPARARLRRPCATSSGGPPVRMWNCGASPIRYPHPAPPDVRRASCAI